MEEPGDGADVAGKARNDIQTPSSAGDETNVVSAGIGPQLGDESLMYKVTFTENGVRKELTSSGRTDTKKFSTYAEAEIVVSRLEKHSTYNKAWAIEEIKEERTITD